MRIQDGTDGHIPPLGRAFCGRAEGLEAADPSDQRPVDVGAHPRPVFRQPERHPVCAFELAVEVVHLQGAKATFREEPEPGVEAHELDAVRPGRMDTAVELVARPQGFGRSLALLRAGRRQPEEGGHSHQKKPERPAA
jgi:hypothetical protein